MPPILMVAPGASPHATRVLRWLLEDRQEIVFTDDVDPVPHGARGYRFTRTLEARGAGFLERHGAADLAWTYRLAVAETQMRLIARRSRFLLTHVHWVGPRALAAARASLRPLVLSVWGSDVNLCLERGAHPGMRGIVSGALAAADCVIVDEESMAEKCRMLAGREVPIERIHVGVDTSLFRAGAMSETARQWRGSLGIPKGARIVLSTRLCAPNYRQEDILEAFAQARAGFSGEVFLVLKRFLAGSRAYLFKLEERARALRIEPFVRWLDPVALDGVPGIYTLADVLVNFPTLDTFPAAFLEAAACERPLISCRLPSYRGTFAEQAFLMVEPWNVGELAAAMVQVLEAPSGTWVAPLARARRVVEAEFDASIAARRLLELYRRLRS